MKSVTKIAPAKINLGLDIVGTREDGYHLLETVFQAVSICDRVTVTLTDAQGIALRCADPAVPCNEKNIAWKAAARFCEAAGLTKGVEILLEKHIPMQAGMGGGSTDGAAVLLALQELTGNPLSREQLCQIAVKLGADVPFFLYGSTAYAAGIGEELEQLPPFAGKHLVIAKGTAGVSTVEAYREIDSLQNPKHPPVQQLRNALKQGADAAEIASLCGNLFEDAVHLPEVAEIRRIMLEQGALCSVMTGSGAAVFGLFDRQETAEQACEILKKHVDFAEVCETL
ncbi:MAG: 4-(cytidine 5'-diphospho)-2-C-methyl-D-erythritol kinase [Ruminococcus sp.]